MMMTTHHRKAPVVLVLMAAAALAGQAHADSEHSLRVNRRLPQASFSIDKAYWRSNTQELRVEGSGTDGASVTLTDALTGALVGSTTVRDSEWEVRLQAPTTVPCRVRAVSGLNVAESDVRGAPSDCSTQAATLTALTVSGPASVNESSSATYTATATYSDGSSADVSSSATWSESSDFASVAGGVLTTSAVSADQSATVSASYSEGGVTASGSADVTILDVPESVTLASLAVAGPTSVSESSSATFTATATYSDGSSADVSSSATWSENSDFASIAGGVLTTSAVSADQSATVSASYSEGGNTASGSADVLILDVPMGTGSHAGRFTTYEGTSTCLTCHRNEAMDVHASVHYQWQGDASDTVGLTSPTAGKLGGINDFCIYPDINWIGQMTNTDGVVVDGGCAKCHVGLGAKPTAETTDAQLENIDCLVCHSDDYQRKVAKRADGSFGFVPDPSKMQVSILEAAWNITTPSTDSCLDCHTKAGGGDNNKRGDIEEAHRTATAAFDVHLAPRSAGGAGLACIDCHVTQNHRIAGRGSDLRPLDSTTTVACVNCHPAAPHSNADLNAHTARLDCSVCHIPTFAKGRSTDMLRDWSAPGDWDAATKLYDPHMTREANVIPEYRFFNGKSYFYQFGEAAVPGPSGSVVMSEPLGAVTDPGAKIHPFKHHRAKQPMDPVTRVLLPLKIGIFFQTGNVDAAIHAGVQAMGWQDNGYEFANTERYMEINHEVAPATQALSCASCHGSGGRMDFDALGYTPKQTRNGKPLCGSCHQTKEMKPFYDLHHIHLDDRHLDCSNCHTFSSAN